MCKVLRGTLAWFCVGSLGWPWLVFLSLVFLTVMFWLGPWDDSSTVLCTESGLSDDCNRGLWNEAGLPFLDLLWKGPWHLFWKITGSVFRLCCPSVPSLGRLEKVGAGAVLLLFWLKFAVVVFLFKSKYKDYSFYTKINTIFTWQYPFETSVCRTRVPLLDKGHQTGR